MIVYKKPGLKRTEKSIVVIFFSFLCIMASMSACGKFEFSPHQDNRQELAPTNLNSINIKRLLENEKLEDDTVTLVYSGDSQRFYQNLEQLVNKVNSLRRIDFFVLCGDIADFGILQEYVWITDRLKKLSIPYVCVIGNHDLAADEGELFTSVFGAKNFSFIYKSYKFLFHDTNGREYGFNGSVPNLWWLSDQLNDTSVSWFVGASHIPPYNIDFDPGLELPYKNLLASKSNFILSLHGHLHSTSDSFHYGDHVNYMTSNAVNKEEFIVIKLIDGKVIKQLVNY